MESCNICITASALYQNLSDGWLSLESPSHRTSPTSDLGAGFVYILYLYLSLYVCKLTSSAISFHMSHQHRGEKVSCVLLFINFITMVIVGCVICKTKCNIMFQEGYNACSWIHDEVITFLVSLHFWGKKMNPLYFNLALHLVFLLTIP